MRVVIYTQYFYGGGAEKRASVYANYLYKHGVDVHAVTMYKTEKEYEIEKGLPRYFVSDSLGEYLKLGKKQRLNGLKKHLLDINLDIVISFLPTFSFYAVLAIKFDKRLKHIKLVHSVALYQRKYSFKERIVDFLCCLHADRISLQCKEQLKCNRLFKKKCFVSFNPIKDNWSNEINRTYDILSIITVGRLTKQKNFKLAIKAINKIHATNKNVSLDIYGDGELKDKLERLINELNANEYIKIHPFSNNLKEEFLNYNVYLSTSRYEGFPNSLVEAMMSGLICLSTPCPTGPKEIIDNGVNGFLFKSIDELADVLDRLKNDKALCNKISIEGRKKAKECFEDKVVLPTYLEEISKIK
ncbi:MAG: glycosyltransferase [Bacilli bacterium]|nr:glycosyltransferase [Bacilli bacterium]